MNVPDVLFHATSKTAWQSIKTEGLKAVFPAVYMTDDIKAAQWFAGVAKSRGEEPVILAIEGKRLDKKLLGRNHEMLCDILKTTPFWNYGDNIPAKHITKLALRKNAR